MASLLPKSINDFHSKDYWDKFFLTRDKNAFEWYGNYKDIAHHLQVSSHIKPSDRFLVIGCGNSNFSTELYDDGYKHIVNIDFSELVIEEMEQKNKHRTEMKWYVEDMTVLAGQTDEAFEIVLDKGALDALISNETIEFKQKGYEMFHQIERVLAKHGKYICISSAEKFIFETLLNYFSSNESHISLIYLSKQKWKISIHLLQTQTTSPFIPLFIEISQDSTLSNWQLYHYFDEFGNIKEQPIQFHSIQDSQNKLYQLQIFHQKYYQLGKLEVGRFEIIQLWSDAVLDIPRFTIFILDFTAQAHRSCAVFLVLFGRESEYQFTTYDGLLHVAQQAECRRLMAVCCNRPHYFPPMSELQAELSPIAMKLRLFDMKENESIPYMALNIESKWEALVEGETKCSGRYLIEEYIEEEEESNGLLYRRLIFLQNQNFIQTEIRMVDTVYLPSHTPTLTTSQRNQKMKSKKKKLKKKSKKVAVKDEGGGMDDDDGLRFDVNYLDDHHRAMIMTLALSHLPLHSSEASVSGLVIGLGGGALPSTLHHYLPRLHLWTCDMDPELLDIAQRYFGFRLFTNPKGTSSSHFIACEGMELIQQLSHRLLPSYNQQTTSSTESIIDFDGLDAIGPLAFICLDADSKDPSLGITAPPQIFWIKSNLITMYDCLKHNGVLLINCVARSKVDLNELELMLIALFDNNSVSGQRNALYKMKPSSETVNTCYVLVKTDSKDSFSTKSTYKKLDIQEIRRNLDDRLDEWLKATKISNDPLHLKGLIPLVTNLFS